MTCTDRVKRTWVTGAMPIGAPRGDVGRYRPLYLMLEITETNLGDPSLLFRQHPLRGCGWSRWRPRRTERERSLTLSRSERKGRKKPRVDYKTRSVGTIYDRG